MKLAVIGASYLQMPLINRAHEKGLEVHAFAWECGDVGETAADAFYPISIVEHDKILEECRRIGVDGVATIASDLAAVTVGAVAHGLGLACNTPDCVAVSTNKKLMRERFAQAGCPSPASFAVESVEEALALFDGEPKLSLPIIVKPTDRSGSRGVTKLDTLDGLAQAVAHAIEQSLNGVAVVEDFLVGREYSVEFISWAGVHHALAITRKFTTGAPTFIETGHTQPCDLDKPTMERVFQVVNDALDALGVTLGSSCSEVMVAPDGSISLVEVAARMGGDFIGAGLVPLSTGYDYVGAVIDCALGIEPPPVADDLPYRKGNTAGVRYVVDQRDIDILNHLVEHHPETIAEADIPERADAEVTDSSNRFGYALFSSPDQELVVRYLEAVDASEL